ncbi:hypothetical protein FGG08_004979 [Glutinoglossum americanum]|uniref:Uncharacterized protein n=1 Tax=Glutinoglossum americanum TaxID=1670608 RepID=A0A9P8HZ49_9PEZI|nr:hypothetical protein FGG08_004979 [Glutinoglossum americanum]
MASLFGTIPIAISPRDLTPTDISLLTYALRRPPTPPDALARQLKREAQAIRALPRRLKAPVPWQGAIVSALDRASANRAGIPGCARRLCRTHRPLNGQLLHALLGLLKRAVRRLPLGAPEPLGRISRLWAGEGGEDGGGGDGVWCVQGDGCEGCILARVGGEAGAVAGLRGLLVAGKGGKGRKRFLRVVEGWVDGFMGDEAVEEAVRARSEEIAKEVLDGRRRGQRRYRGHRRPAPLTVTTDSDPEISVIGHYAGLVSHSYLPPNCVTPFPGPHQFSLRRSPEEEGFVHPAFQRDGGSRASLVRSSSGGDGASFPPRSSDERAASYQDVVCKPFQDDASSGYSSDDSRATRWGTFCRQ